MSLFAEQLLAMTGLLPPYNAPAGTPWPDRNAVRGAKTILEDLTKQMLEALDRREPIRLRTRKTTATYFERLAVEPDYASMMESLEPLVGLGMAAEYQDLHMSVRQLVMGRHPTINVETVNTTLMLASDAVSEAKFLFEADVVENQRICLDLQACALYPASVDIFAQAFPLIYAELFTKLETAMVEKTVKGWRPPYWLDYSLRRFLQAPMTGVIDLSAAPPTPPKNSRGSLNVKALAVPGTEVPK